LLKLQTFWLLVSTRTTNSTSPEGIDSSNPWINWVLRRWRPSWKSETGE